MASCAMTIRIAIQPPNAASTGVALTEPRLKIRAATHIKAAHILRISGAATYETKAGKISCSASIVTADAHFRNSPRPTKKAAQNSAI